MKVRIREYDRDPGDRKDVRVLMWKLTPASWRTLRRSVKDPERLGASYRAWAARERARRQECLRKGYDVRQVAFDIDAWKRWCARRRLPLDLRSCGRFILERSAVRRAPARMRPA